MRRLLISAYACEPGVGSEPGVGWNWTVRLARQFDEVHVVTRTGDRFVKNGSKGVRDSRKHIEQAVARAGSELAHVHFHYFDLPNWIANWERTTAGDMLNVYLWEAGVFFFLKKRFRRRAFDVAQKVTIVSHRFPSLAWYFARRYVHGPIAGGERYPLRLLSIFSLKNRLRELARFFFQLTPLVDPLVRLTWAKADEIIAVTEQTKSLLPQSVQRKCRIEQAAFVDEDHFIGAPQPVAKRPVGESFRLLYAGKLIEYKGLWFLLKALATLQRDAFSLTVIGDGPDRARLKQVADGLPVRFEGFVPRERLADYYTSHDLFVFPSLRDSGGFVVLEAQAHGLPVLTLDLGGPYVNLDRKTGGYVTVAGKSPDEVAQSLAGRIERIRRQQTVANEVYRS